MPDGVTNLSEFVTYLADNLADAAKIQEILAHPRFAEIAANYNADTDLKKAAIAGDILYNYNQGGEYRYNFQTGTYGYVMPDGVTNLSEFVTYLAENPADAAKIQEILSHPRFAEIAANYNADTDLKKAAIAGDILYNYNQGGEYRYNFQTGTYGYVMPDGVTNLSEFVTYLADNLADAAKIQEILAPEIRRDRGQLQRRHGPQESRHSRRHPL